VTPRTYFVGWAVFGLVFSTGFLCALYWVIRWAIEDAR